MEPIVKLTTDALQQGDDTCTNSDFYLESEQLVARYANAEPITFEGFVVALFQTGRAEMSVNGRKYKVCGGDLLLLAPNTVLKYYGATSDYTATKIVVTLDVIMDFPTPFDTDIIGMARRRPIVRLNRADYEMLQDCLALIGKNYNSTQCYRKEILKTLFYAMLLTIGSIYKRSEGDADDTDTKFSAEKLSDTFFKYVAQYYKEHRTVKFYADKMHLTPKYLSKAIVSITGKTVMAWLDEAVILEIKIQLKTSDLSVWQIAENLHFSSSSAMVQFFKKNTGVTPLKYRETEEW
ncbi:MAG: helix-turn-helix domain-containing protein [Paludibacteraceae bacterium]